MSVRHWFLSLACAAAPLAGSAPVLAAGSVDKTPVADQPAKAPALTGSLHALDEDAAQTQALDWLKKVGKSDAVTLTAFDAVWAQKDRSVLDRVADGFALGNAEAAQLLIQAQDPAAPAPTVVPILLKDAAQPIFFRANLGLAYGRALSNRRVFEEALEVLRLVKPEDVVDPATYFFHRAVAEHALLLKSDASRSIIGLQKDVVDAPERYRMVSDLIGADLDNWRDKDLGEIARKMDNIERRLELARGGPKTQKIQKEVVARLDELIKKLENQNKGGGGGSSNGGGCPDGGSPPDGSGGSAQGNPMNDSNIATLGGPGKVDQKHLSGLAKQWGKLPEKERTKAMLELTRDMPPRHREVIENYIKKISQASSSAP